MKARELRIGNLINTDGVLTEITGITEWSIFFKGGHQLFVAGGIEPIPLTEEWLIKFGFEKSDSGYELDSINYCYWFEKQFPIIGELCQSSDKTYLFDVETDTLRINYVHQLQNLYFALTEQELTLKETE